MIRYLVRLLRVCIFYEYNYYLYYEYKLGLDYPDMVVISIVQSVTITLCDSDFCQQIRQNSFRRFDTDI